MHGLILCSMACYTGCYAAIVDVANITEDLTFTIASNGTLTVGGGSVNGSSAAVRIPVGYRAIPIDNVWVTDNRAIFTPWVLTANATGWTLNGLPVNNKVPALMYSTLVSSNGTVSPLVTPVDLAQQNAILANCTVKAGTVIITPMVAIKTAGGRFANGVYAVNITYYLNPTS